MQFGVESGTLRVGQRGGSTTDYRTMDYRTTPLLPAGWSVASIDVQKGRLTLRQGEPVFLDDQTLEAVAAQLPVPIRLVHGADDVVAGCLADSGSTH